MLKKVSAQTRGAALVEYVVLFAVLSIGLIAVLITFGGVVDDPFDDGTRITELVEFPELPDTPTIVVPVVGGGTATPTGTVVGPGGGPDNPFVYTGCEPPGGSWDPVTSAYYFDVPVFGSASSPNYRDRLVFYPFDEPIKLVLPLVEDAYIYTTIRGWNTTNTAAWFEYGYTIPAGGLGDPTSGECVR